MTVTYADISHHQVTVDMAAYKAAGHDRIAIKATGGANDDTLRYEDPAFGTRWHIAGTLGLKRMAYHYARNVNNGGEEWRWFLSCVLAAGGLNPGDVLCLDTEDTHLQARAVAYATEFMAAALADGYPDGVVYTGRWYAEPNKLSAAVFAPGWRRLWLSHYDQSTPDSQILMPTGWTRDQLISRQYTDSATVAGISGGCDYSRLFTEWTTPGEIDMPLTTDDISAIVKAVHTDVATMLADSNHAYLPPVHKKLDAISAAVAPLADDEAKILAAVAAVAPGAGVDPAVLQQAVSDVFAKLRVTVAE